MKFQISNDRAKYQSRSIIEKSPTVTKVMEDKTSTRNLKDFSIDDRGYFCWGSNEAIAKDTKHR
jgi:hypothetical protein